jgi:hypothetical protein
MSSTDGCPNSEEPDSSTRDSSGRQELQDSQRTSTRRAPQGTSGSSNTAHVIRSTASSHEQRSQAPASGSASHQTVHTTGDRESSRSRHSRQRLSGTNERLHVSPLRVPAGLVAPTSGRLYHVQRITGGPSFVSQDTGLQPSHGRRAMAMNRLMAGSGGPDTVRQARSRAMSASRGEIQGQTHSASIVQNRLTGLHGQQRPSGGSMPPSVGLVPLMGNLTLGAEPSTRLFGEQQAPDSSSARPVDVPLAAFQPLGTIPHATSASVRLPMRQSPLPQVFEESLRNPSISLVASAGYPTIPPPRAKVQTTSSSVRPPHSAGAGTAAGSPMITSQSGPRIINIGIETEFLLAAHREDHAAETLEEFARILAADHNLRVRGTQKRMRIGLRSMEYIGEYTEWCLVKDYTIERHTSPCKPFSDASVPRHS